MVDVDSICVEISEIEIMREDAAKNYLDYIRSLDMREKRLREEIEREKSVCCPGGISYSDRVQGGDVYIDAIPDAVIRLHELVSDYCTELAEYAEQRYIAHRCINKLSIPSYQTALSGYYMCGKTWEQVAVDMCYSYPQIMRIKRTAMVELYDIMPLQWRVKIPDAAQR